VPGDVVLLPSLGRPATDFADLVRRLESSGYRAHPVEPPKAVAAGANLHDVANSVATHIGARGVGSFHLVGHAFGNRLARMIAADFPDHIASLTLLAAGGYAPMPADVMQSLVACFDTTLPEEEHLAHVGRAFFAPGHDPSVWASGWMSEVAAWQTTALEATARHDWWDAIAPQVLVIQGLADAVAPPENGRRYVGDHTDVARLIEIPDAGHALIVEQPELVGRAVLSFLTEVDGSGDVPLRMD
jgi:pimeloyl-ACP methyl ester carboxylesterase